MKIQSIGDLERLRICLLEAFGEVPDNLIVECNNEIFDSIRKYIPNIPNNIALSKCIYRDMKIKLEIKMNKLK